MSHRNTPTRTKVASAKRAKKAPNPKRVASGSSLGGTKQETVLGLLKQPQGYGASAGRAVFVGTAILTGPANHKLGAASADSMSSFVH
jgi:hypothetical protein